MRAQLPGRRRPAAGSEAAAGYAAACYPGRRTGWRDTAWCALDFELTGLDLEEDEIISFGAIPIEGGAVALQRAVSGLVRPLRELSDVSIRVHGIRAADLSLAPSLPEALAPLLQALAGRPLVVHTAAVERSFLAGALRRQGLRLRGPIADVELLGRLWLHQRDGGLRRRMGLPEIAAELGLPAERPHNALSDALTTAQVFIALCTHLDASHAETVGTLTHARRRLEAVRAYGLLDTVHR